MARDVATDVDRGGKPRDVCRRGLNIDRKRRCASAETLGTDGKRINAL